MNEIDIAIVVGKGFAIVSTVAAVVALLLLPRLLTHDRNKRGHQPIER